MSSAQWSPVTNASSATWDKNKSRADLERTTPIYDDPTLAYDDIATYYDGFNPSTYTPEGEAGAIWSSPTQGTDTDITFDDPLVDFDDPDALFDASADVGKTTWTGVPE